jgi:hypothetical protein
LEERIAFATRLQFEAENVFVKRLCPGQIINLDRHVITPVDLNAHTPALCASCGQKGTRFCRRKARNERGR